MAAANPAQQNNAPSPSAVVVNGQTVPIAAANEVNAIDLAADNAPPAESTLPRGDRTDLAAALAAKAAQVKDSQARDSQVAFAAPTPTVADQNAGGENAAAQNASAQDASAQDVSAQDASAQNASAQDTDDQGATAQNSSPVGSASWMAQVLAALGGAMAAATVAWFLIGAGPPVRDYG